MKWKVSGCEENCKIEMEDTITWIPTFSSYAKKAQTKSNENKNSNTNTHWQPSPRANEDEEEENFKFLPGAKVIRFI